MKLAMSVIAIATATTMGACGGEQRGEQGGSADAVANGAADPVCTPSAQPVEAICSTHDDCGVVHTARVSCNDQLGLPSLAAASADRAYFGSPAGHESRRSVLLTFDRGGDDTIETLPKGATDLQVLARDGKPIVLSQLFKHRDVLERRDGSWQTTPVPGSEQEGDYSVGAALQPDGRLTMLTESPLLLSTRATDGTWSRQTISDTNTTNQGSAFALDAKGQAHAFYFVSRESSSGSSIQLRHATATEAPRDVPVPGSLGQMSIVMTGDPPRPIILGPGPNGVAVSFPSGAPESDTFEAAPLGVRGFELRGCEDARAACAAHAVGGSSALPPACTSSGEGLRAPAKLVATADGSLFVAYVVSRQEYDFVASVPAPGPTSNGDTCFLAPTRQQIVTDVHLRRITKAGPSSREIILHFGIEWPNVAIATSGSALHVAISERTPELHTIVSYVLVDSTRL